MTIRVAVPNKGSLAEAAAHLLVEAGYSTRSDSKDLAVFDSVNDIEFFYLRPRDIAIYVGSGRIDIGITGRDLVIDSAANVKERLGLGFARSTFRFAAPDDQRLQLADLAGKRIATSYPHLVGKYLTEHGITAQIVRLDGAVEISVQLGVADLIADVVESGRSLRQNNLTAFGDPICFSEAIIIQRSDEQSNSQYDQFIARIQGVVFAQNYVMLDYDCPQTLLPQAIATTPGLESPTVSPLADNSWVAVRSLVPRSEANSLMDQLATLGAKAILMSDIRSCRV